MRTILEFPSARLLKWYREHKDAIRDLIILLVLSVLTYFYVLENDLMDALYAFSRQYEAVELDELILTIGIVSSVYGTIFAIRRWAEATKLLRESNTDSLTKLFNRRKGWEMIEYEIVRSDRYQSHLSIIMLDIDHFKTINDTYGHQAGDTVLKVVAQVAQESVRKNDELIRWGGEEFIVLLPNTDLEGALLSAERLRAAIADTFIKTPHEDLRITASFGVAVKDKNTPNLETLLARVDQAMYIAKYKGRNRVACSK